MPGEEETRAAATMLEMRSRIAKMELVGCSDGSLGFRV
jgi:hypothetical protein